MSFDSSFNYNFRSSEPLRPALKNVQPDLPRSKSAPNLGAKFLPRDSAASISLPDMRGLSAEFEYGDSPTPSAEPSAERSSEHKRAKRFFPTPKASPMVKPRALLSIHEGLAGEPQTPPPLFTLDQSARTTSIATRVLPKLPAADQMNQSAQTSLNVFDAAGPSPTRGTSTKAGGLRAWTPPSQKVTPPKAGGLRSWSPTESPALGPVTRHTEHNRSPRVSAADDWALDETTTKEQPKVDNRPAPKSNKLGCCSIL